MRFRKLCLENPQWKYSPIFWDEVVELFWDIFKYCVWRREKVYPNVVFGADVSSANGEIQKIMSEYNFNTFGRIARQSHATLALNSMSNFNWMNDALNIIDSLNIGK